jgi:cytochrome c oxidase subunit 4
MSSHATSHDPRHASPDAQHGGAHAEHHHIVDGSVFMRVLIALLFLTFVTVGASRIDFGGANMLIAMAIASVKASLVIAIFMHLWWDTAVNRIMFLGSFLFLSLLFLFTLADQGTRGRSNQIHRVKAPVDRQWVHPSLQGGSQH